MADWLQITAGSPLLHWAMSAPEERHYPGIARPMPDKVDYRFRNGWTDTGDLPCREALRAELPDRRISRPMGPFDDLVIGLDGAELDFSRFCHRPTLVARSFLCRIRGEGLERFRLGTCGGVRLWLGEDEVARFEPFLRNHPQTAEVALPLTDAPLWLTLLLEDLHERDTTCFFSLTLLSGTAVATALPDGFDSSEVSETAAVLASLRTEGVFHESGAVTLVADHPPARRLDLTLPNVAMFSRGGLVADPAVANTLGATLTQDRPATVLMDSAAAPPGCISLPVEARVGQSTLRRQLGTTILPRGTRLSGPLEDRKSEAADLIARADGFEPTIAALLAIRKVRPDRVARIVAATLTTIEERHDCSDFSILPLLRLWRDGLDGLPPALTERLRRAILGYRYWLDEPGNDVMWFWSENHVLCFHTAQLIAGRLFPDDRFPNAGCTGADHAGRAARRLDLWFDAILAHGLCEWNSAAYYPIDMLGLFTLCDMAPDFTARARQVLDRIFVMAALHASGGVPAGTQGRCYEKELLAGPMTELGSVMAIALGGDFRVGYDRASGLFCLSDYAPPDLVALARPAPGDWLLSRYTQGLDHEGKLTLWKSADGQLSSVCDLKTGEQGHQAQVVDVQLSRHPMARLWINHPGETKPWGEQRPSLLAGNHVMPRVVQHGPVALMIYDLQRPWTDLQFTQLFAAEQAFGPPRICDGWHVFAGDVAIWCSSPLQPETTGLYRGSLWRAHATRSAWAVAMRQPGESAPAFEVRLGRATMSFDPERLALQVGDLGDETLNLRFDGPFQVGGQDSTFAPLSPVPHLSWNDGPMLPIGEA